MPTKDFKLFSSKNVAPISTYKLMDIFLFKHLESFTFTSRVEITFVKKSVPYINLPLSAFKVDLKIFK